MRAEVAVVLGEFQREQLRSSAQICWKIHKTWLQEVFVFQIVPPLIVLHVATIAWSPRSTGTYSVLTEVVYMRTN